MEVIDDFLRLGGDRKTSMKIQPFLNTMNALFSKSVAVLIIRLHYLRYFCISDSVVINKSRNIVKYSSALINMNDTLKRANSSSFLVKPTTLSSPSIKSRKAKTRI